MLLRGSARADFELSLHIYEYLAVTADRLSMDERVLVRHAFLLDYAGLSWKHLNPRIFFRLRPEIAILDAYYPEFVGTATCINAPNIFVHLWSIVSPWLSEATRARVTTVDQKHTRGVLQKLAATSSLPRLYGGAHDALPADVKTSLGVDDMLARLRGLYDTAAAGIAAAL